MKECLTNPLQTGLQKKKNTDCVLVGLKYLQFERRNYKLCNSMIDSSKDLHPVYFKGLIHIQSKMNRICAGTKHFRKQDMAGFTEDFIKILLLSLPSMLLPCTECTPLRSMPSACSPFTPTPPIPPSCS